MSPLLIKPSLNSTQIRNYCIIQATDQSSQIAWLRNSVNQHIFFSILSDMGIIGSALSFFPSYIFRCRFSVVARSAFGSSLALPRCPPRIRWSLWSCSLSFLIRLICLIQHLKKSFFLTQHATKLLVLARCYSNGCINVYSEAASMAQNEVTHLVFNQLSIWLKTTTSWICHLWNNLVRTHATPCAHVLHMRVVW